MAERADKKVHCGNNNNISFKYLIFQEKRSNKLG